MAEERIGIKLDLEAQTQSVEEVLKKMRELAASADAAQQKFAGFAEAQKRLASQLSAEEELAVRARSAAAGGASASPAASSFSGGAGRDVGDELVSGNKEIADEIRKLAKAIESAKSDARLAGKPLDLSGVIASSSAQFLKNMGYTVNGKGEIKRPDGSTANKEKGKSELERFAGLYRFKTLTGGLYDTADQVVGQLGQGNALGASAQLLKGLGDTMYNLDVPVVGELAAIAGGGLSTLNAVSSVYESYIPSVRAARWRGGWRDEKADGKNVTPMASKDILERANLLAQNSGRSLDEAFKVSDLLAASGVRDSWAQREPRNAKERIEAMQAGFRPTGQTGKAGLPLYRAWHKGNQNQTQEVMRFAGHYIGADTGLMAESLGKGLRYGGEGGGRILGYAAAVNNANNAGNPAMFNESLKSLGLMFEHALSKGVKVVNVKDLAKAQIAFGKLGEHWQGERGAAKIAQMDASIAGASFGSRQGQLINMVLAQNWDELAKGTEFEGSKYDLAEAYLYKERYGHKPELIGKILETIKSLSGNDELSELLMIKEHLNAGSYQAADELRNGNLSALDVAPDRPPLGARNDKEEDDQKNKNKTAMEMAIKGAGALELKNEIEGKMLDALDGLKGTLDGIETALDSLKAIPDAINGLKNYLSEKFGI